MEFVAALAGTVVGGLITFISEWITRRSVSRRRELDAVNNLVLDLAAKRAFLVSPDWDWAEGELDRVTGSVRHARDLIRSCRLEVQPDSKFVGQLREMTRQCNEYLEAAEHESEHEVERALARLCTALRRSVGSLHALAPRRIQPDPPGSSAL